MKQLWSQYPFRSEKKFVPIAIENGFTKEQAKQFLSKINHDQKINPRDYFLPIYSEHSNAFQFDTLVQTSKSNPRYFLVIINVNSRKIYVYPMKSKGTKDVLEVLNKFLNEVHSISAMTSDQDKAYLSDEVLMFMKQNKIDYRTTSEHDHNRLGIINRVMRTLRDMNHDRDFTIESMMKCVRAYNDSIHSSIGTKPNSFTNEDEKKYINKKRMETDEHRKYLPIGSYVRTVQLRKPFSKRRSNLSEDSYIVDSMQGNKYLIRAKDDSIALFPRHQLVPTRGTPNLGNSLDDGRRGVVDKILSYSKGKYKIIYEDGSTDTVSPIALREERPAALSIIERRYWNGKSIPDTIKKFI